MKKIYFILLSFLLCLCIDKVYATEYITYSEWSEEYPYWLKEKFIQSEERYLWYRKILNSETNEIEREETTTYYKELDGYIKIEESMKMFYRYITNDRVLIDGQGNIVYDIDYCYKEYCSRVRLPSRPVEEEPEIENPKTYDNIFVLIIIAFLSFVSIVLVLNTSKKAH